jgi:hypothetical protein
MVREDADAIYIADPHGTWMLPRDSYERLVEWSGGLSAPKHLAPTGQPVVAELREGATIYDITPRKVRKGGDPIERRKWRLALDQIFSLDGKLPTTDRTHVGEKQLLQLEEMFGRRMGWDAGTDINEQVFAGHHLRSASWNCEGDGGGS